MTIENDWSWPQERFCAQQSGGIKSCFEANAGRELLENILFDEEEHNAG
ncbi:MAG TPA: hypothetical protein VMT22_11925 [Terriglobales bacterium]|nr:hypothetical protein [Terriglobales bacterium]